MRGNGGGKGTGIQPSLEDSGCLDEGVSWASARARSCRRLFWRRASSPSLLGQRDGRLGIELNKLESFEGGCRSFFLFRNRIGLTLSSFEMSLAILNKGGVIDRLLTIDAAPLPADRTTLKLFELPDMACEAVGQVILHDISACSTAGEAPGDCFALVELSSLADAPALLMTFRRHG